MHNSWNSSMNEFSSSSKKMTAIGIDLGTTNSCVGLWIEKENRVKLLRNPLGNAEDGKTTPTMVHYNTSNEAPDVGAAALPYRETDPRNTIHSIKRFMGRTMADISAQDRAYFQYHLRPASTASDAPVVVELSKSPPKSRRRPTTTKTPAEISAQVLLHLKDLAEIHVGEPVSNAVITVPAYFNDHQRRATLEAAELAGFRGIRLLNEPTAAAMAYGLFIAGKKHVLIFDLGGGTFDVSLLAIDEGIFDVMGIGGDTRCGGEDFNQQLFQFLQQAFRHEWANISSQEVTQIQVEIERVKIELSTQDRSTFHGPRQVSHEFTRAAFELICKDLLTKCIDITTGVLEEAQMSPDQIDEVILVGGSTRLPFIRSTLTQMFPGKELCTSINADEAVAEGAAIQAAVLSGVDHQILRDVLMMDVIPLSIGLEKQDGQMEILLPRNTKIPTSKTKYFQTFADDQRGLTIEVYEGEHPQAQSNVHISYFNFLLPKNKIGLAGVHLHPVTFTMNENGILQIQAGIYNDEENSTDEETVTQLRLLVVYLVLLFGLYVGSRLYFNDPNVSWV